MMPTRFSAANDRVSVQCCVLSGVVYNTQ